MSTVRPGLLIAIIVFAVFGAYAFLAPATYRASALLVVDSASSANPVTLPEPLEAGRRLSEAVLDRYTLELLSRERAGSAAPEAQAHAASTVRESLAIDTSDAHAFSISYKDSDRARAQRVCNQLTDHAVVRAPQVLVDHSAERALDLRYREQTQELAAFLALHPDVAAERPPSGDRSPEKDPALSAFHAEKANLEQRLLELESGVGSDNPYREPSETDPKLLRRRLAEINDALSARRQAFDTKPSLEPLSPELRAEWRRLLAVVTTGSSEAEKQVHPVLVARVVARAELPAAPIDPNRPLLLLFGVVFGTGLGAAFTVVVRATQQRRTKSSKPPAPSQTTLTVQLPAAPAVPSGLVPVVPVVPVAPPARALQRAPAIVPIPQRPISSSPPGPGPGPAPAQNGFGNTRPMAKSEQAAARPEATDAPPRAAAIRFASTLVLPPPENPSPITASASDPVLASAARVWDDQIRAHEIPGFAVVRPGSEPPEARGSSSAPPPVTTTSSVPPPRGSSNPPPAATVRRATSRPPNQMKVTQPLGSFLPDGVWNDPVHGITRSRTPGEQLVPRSPLPPKSPAVEPASRYSYVSTAPPSKNSIVRVHEVPAGWQPDASLTPAAQRALCEQLNPNAVESCFVVVVVAVPESVHYKSRVAAELALALAESNHPRVLLLDGDFHRPFVQRIMHVDLPLSAGFSQQLHARIHGTADSRWTVMACTKSLHVLAEGMMRSPGLVLSKQFLECVTDLRGYYDFIVVDGPTNSIEVDSNAIGAICDGLVTVCPQKGSAALAEVQALFGRKRFSAIATSP